MKKSVKNPYEKLLRGASFDVGAPFAFSVKDDLMREDENGNEVEDREYLKAASLVHTNGVFHKEAALFSATLANNITKETFDATVLALAYVKEFVVRFEQLHAKLLEEESPQQPADTQSIVDNSLDTTNSSVVFNMDFQS